MSRLPLVRVEEMDDAQRAQYERFPSNLTRALLLTEQRLAGALPNVANALRTSGLDPKLREGVILRVAALSASPYERMQHLEQAEKAGWSAAQIVAIETGDVVGLPEDFAFVVPFVDECVATPRVSDAAFEAVRGRLSNRDIATLILLIGHYMTVARLVATLDVELDPSPDRWESEH